MHVDLNTIISQEIKGAVEAEVHKLKSDLQLPLIHLQQQVDAYRQKLLNVEQRQSNDTTALKARIEELAADIGRWKGKQLEPADAPTRGEHDELHTQVQSLEKQVVRINRERDFEDDRFQQDVKAAVEELLEDGDLKLPTSAVLDQDNENARIRDLVRDVLQDEDFTDSLLSDDFLSKRVVELFQQGPLVISVDRV